MNHSDVFKLVTDKVIANLEKAGNWAKMFKCPQPISLNGHVYRGINFLLLASMDHDIPVYGTFQQIRSNGGRVKKGEKASLIVFWNKYFRDDEDPENDQGHFFLKLYYVFNVSQAEFDEQGVKKISLMQEQISNQNNLRSIEADQVIESMPNPPIIKHSNQVDYPSYAPGLDRIRMPHMKWFSSSDEYYATLFHEMVHSTGHPKRLNRFELGSTRFGDESYSREELVAELGSAYLSEIAHLDTNFRNKAAYIKGWASALRENNRWITWAANKAEQACKHILKLEEAEVAH
ncbi:MAG: zincin-like metallopeptidase domain-containing protein [Bacteroidales bacterium]